MFIINRKRIYLILVCLILSTVAFNINYKKDLETQVTVALPANNKTIILDAGHGRRRPEEQ